MTATPFMQLYIADYLGDTLHLTTEQHGAYLLILMAMWRADGRLPNDPSKLARIARVSPRRWHLICDDVMAFFDVDGCEITQKRLVEERQKAVSISEKRSASGKLGGTAKALKSNGSSVASAKQVPEHSQKPDTRKEDANASFAREFEETFWPEYPLKKGKPAALKAFIAARKHTDLETIMAGVRRYAAERAGQDPKFTKYPQGWLSGAHWADETTPIFAPQQRAASPPPETVSSLSRKQLLEQRQNDDTDNSSGRVVQIDARRLENSPSGARTFAVSGNLLGRL